jgi:hypothetical protein
MVTGQYGLQSFWDVYSLPFIAQSADPGKAALCRTPALNHVTLEIRKFLPLWHLLPKPAPLFSSLQGPLTWSLSVPSSSLTSQIHSKPTEPLCLFTSVPATSHHHLFFPSEQQQTHRQEVPRAPAHQDWVRGGDSPCPGPQLSTDMGRHPARGAASHNVLHRQDRQVRASLPIYFQKSVVVLCENDKQKAPSHFMVLNEVRETHHIPLRG